MSKAPVSVIGKYQVAELVGEGAMGAVYRALDPVINRSVAIKVMSDAIARDGALRDRFLREAQAAGSLQHPNVVTVYDFGEFDGHLYIAMEFVEGMDLDQLLQQHVPLPLDQRLAIIIDVLLGLSYAHKHGVVHRDIKPANIRVTEEGRAKIMDFGVAHLDSGQLTATGVMVGTPNYMAPEQITGQRVGPATDLFSVGAVLYELLSHRKAFGADSLHNVLFKVVSEEPPPLAIVAPEVPARLEPILRRALAKEPKDRYQTAQEMANDLTAVRSSLGGASTPALSLGATIASQTAEHRARAAVARGDGRWSWQRVMGATVVGAVALVGGTWAYLARPGAASAGGAARGAGHDSAAVVTTPLPPLAPESAAVRPSAAASGEAATTRRAPPSATGADGSPAAPPAAPPPATGRETQIVAAVRASALSARERAVAAGATREQLAPGDLRLAEADRLTSNRRYADAVAAFNGASTAWGEVERGATSPRPGDARADAAAPAGDGGPRPAASPVVPAPIVAAPPSPGLATAGATRGESLAAPAVSPAAAITARVTAYARAIEARDLTAIRGLYPSITAEQQRGFERFFASVRTLRAVLRTAPPVVDGATATSRISGEYEFTDADGKAQRQAVTFSAVFRHDGTAWRIREVR